MSDEDKMTSKRAAELRQQARAEIKANPWASKIINDYAAEVTGCDKTVYAIQSHECTQRFSNFTQQVEGLWECDACGKQFKFEIDGKEFKPMENE